MEWVETTGKTVEQALDAALDMLGVHEEDVEYEVLQEPKSGLLGRFGGSDARIRARLKPISREKPGERRGKRRRDGERGRKGGEGGGHSSSTATATAERDDDQEAETTPTANGNGDGKGEGAGNGSGRSGGRNRRRRSGGGSRKDEDNGGAAVSDESTVPVEEQAAAAVEFTEGLLEAFGLSGQVSSSVEDDTISLEVQGDGLGLLIGPRAATVGALEEIVRAVVQRTAGGSGARVHVDVAGYRAKRREALAAFAREAAGRAVESGREQALEPMSSPDRKVVHDALIEFDGVETTSEGEDPRRYVVIRPAS